MDFLKKIKILGLHEPSPVPPFVPAVPIENIVFEFQKTRPETNWI